MTVSFVQDGEQVASFDVQRVPDVGDKVRFNGKTYAVTDAVQELFGRNDSHTMELTVKEI